MKIITTKSSLFIATFFILFGFIFLISPNKSEASWCEHGNSCNDNYNHGNHHDLYNFNTYNGNLNTYSGNLNTYSGNYNTYNGNFNTYNGNYSTYNGNFNTYTGCFNTTNNNGGRFNTTSYSF